MSHVECWKFTFQHTLHLPSSGRKSLSRQPTNQMANKESPAKVQDVVPSKLRPFRRTKRIAWIGKHWKTFSSRTWLGAADIKIGQAQSIIGRMSCFKAAHRFWWTGHFCSGGGQVHPVLELPFFLPGWRVTIRPVVHQGTSQDTVQFRPTAFTLRKTLLAWASGCGSRSYQGPLRCFLRRWRQSFNSVASAQVCRYESTDNWQRATVCRTWLRQPCSPHSDNRRGRRVSAYR
jgi:hypothetical protein